jgi:dUTP pyrophosphatase
MKVRFKKLSEKAATPSYAKPGDAGLDLVAISKTDCDSYIEYGTGIAVELPEGYVGLVFPRSSISSKSLALSNSVGVVDSGYRGEIKFRFKATPTFHQHHYEVGDKIGQLVIMPYPQIELEEVLVLNETVRGTGGFGSSGS